MMKILRSLEEENLTVNKAIPLWIWGVIWNGFITRSLRRDSLGLGSIPGFKLIYYTETKAPKQPVTQQGK